MALHLLHVLGLFVILSPIVLGVQNAATSISNTGGPFPTGSGGQRLSGTTVQSQRPPFPTASGSYTGQLRSLNENVPLTVTGEFPCLTANSYVIFTDDKSSSATYPVWTCTTSCGDHSGDVGLMVFPTSTTTGTYEILNPPSGYPALAVSNLAISTDSAFSTSTFYSVDGSSSVPANTLIYTAFPGLSLTVTTTSPISAAQATPISVPTTCGGGGSAAGGPKSGGITSSLRAAVSNVSPIPSAGSAIPSRPGVASNVVLGPNSPPYLTTSPAPDGPFSTASSISASSIPAGAVAYTDRTSARTPSGKISAFTSVASVTNLNAPSNRADGSSPVPPYHTPDARSNQPIGSGPRPSISNALPTPINMPSPSASNPVLSDSSGLSNQGNRIGPVPPYPTSNSHLSQRSGSNSIPASFTALSTSNGVPGRHLSSSNGQMAVPRPTSVPAPAPLGTKPLPMGVMVVTSTIATPGSISTSQVVIESFSLTTSVSGIAWQIPNVGPGAPVFSTPTVVPGSPSKLAPTAPINIPTTELANSNLPAFKSPPLTKPVVLSATAKFVTFSGTTTPDFIEISTGVSRDSHTQATGGAQPHPIFHGSSHFCILFCPPHLRCDVCGYSLDLLPGRVYPPGSIKPPPGVKPIDITISVDEDGNPVYDESGEPDSEKQSDSEPSQDSTRGTASHTETTSSSASPTSSASSSPSSSSATSTSSSCSTSAIVSNCNVLCSSAASSTASCSTSCSSTSTGCSARGTTITSTTTASACEILQPFSSLITGDIPSSFDVVSFFPITIGSPTSPGGTVITTIPSTPASTTDSTTSPALSKSGRTSNGAISSEATSALEPTHSGTAPSSTKSSPKIRSQASSDASSISPTSSTTCYSGFHGPDNNNYDQNCNGMCQGGTCLAVSDAVGDLSHRCVCPPEQVACVLGEYACISSTTTARAPNSRKRAINHISDKVEGSTDKQLGGIAAKDTRRAIVSQGKNPTKTLIRRDPDPTWNIYGPSGTRYWEQFQARDVNQPDDALCNFAPEYHLEASTGKLLPKTRGVLDKVGIGSNDDFYRTTVKYPQPDANKGDTTALFINQFSPGSGTIIAADNTKGTAPDHWSTIAWYLWQRAYLSANPGTNPLTADFSGLKYVLRKEIKNPQTARIIQLAMAGKELDTVQYFYPTNPGEWEKTSNAFWALLGSPNGQGIINLLTRQKAALHSKTIKRIGVLVDSDFSLDKGYGGHMWAELE